MLISCLETARGGNSGQSSKRSRYDLGAFLYALIEKIIRSPYELSLNLMLEANERLWA